MLWISGALALIVWFILKVFLHKGPGIHVILLFAVASFVTQFVQDQRTRAYRADR
jgi:Zn-dependent protease with chaperone function